MPEHEESVLAETAPFPFGPQNWNPQKIQTTKKDVAFVVFLFYTNYIPMYVVERALSIYNRIIVLLLNDQPHFFQNLFMGPGAHCHINPGCLNGGMAHKVRQMLQILLLFI